MISLDIPKNTVEDIIHVTSRGPWKSKSGGELTVQLALPREATAAFLNYDNQAFKEVEAQTGLDIRGLRSYTVSGIPEGSVGGKEWHAARTEYARAIGGSALWHCVDQNGTHKEFVLDSTSAVITPPGILHTYEALEDNTSIQVICNTLFIPEDPRTHDSYSEESFNDFLRRDVK